MTLANGYVEFKQLAIWKCGIETGEMGRREKYWSLAGLLLQGARWWYDEDDDDDDDDAKDFDFDGEEEEGDIDAGLALSDKLPSSQQKLRCDPIYQKPVMTIHIWCLWWNIYDIW